jgi:hypothetical protein
MDKYKLLIIILDPVLFTGCVILQQQQQKKKSLSSPGAATFAGVKKLFLFLSIFKMLVM